MSAPAQQRLAADPDVTRTWIKTLIGHAANCYFGVSASFNGNLSNRFYPVTEQGIEAAVRQIMTWDKQLPQGIYLQSTLLKTPPPPGKRGGEAAVHALTHFWLDGDYGTEGHKPGLDDLPHPPDAATILTIVGDSPLPDPTGYGWSGGGGNGIWMLAEPYIITGDEDRARIKALTVGWQKIAGAAAHRAGFTWDIDVGNLDRLMKAIGTVRRKVDCPERPTSIGNASGAVYELAEIEKIVAEFLPDAEATLAEAAREKQERRAQRTGTAAPPPRPPRSERPYQRSGDGPLDVVADMMTFGDVLLPDGWTYQGQHSDGREAWLRPTADGDRPSSTYSLLCNDHVAVNWSDRADLPVGAQPPGYKLTVGKVYAHLNYGGNVSEAARDIMRAAAGRPAGVAAQLPTAVLAEVKRRCLTDDSYGLRDTAELRALIADDPWNGPQDEPPEDTGEAASEPTDRLPETFWNATAVLQQIRQMAQARRTSPDAVVHAVLARTAAMADPTVRVDSGIHLPATLGWYCGLFGPSGAGKGQAEKAAKELTPFPSVDLAYIDISTGQGLIAAYLDLETDPEDDNGKKKVLVQKRTRGYALATEGSILDAMAQMSAAASLNGVLCKAWMSERQGTSNAEVERRRALAEDSYTLSMSLGVQEEPAAKLLEMGSIGLPQRLAWAHATLGPGTPEKRPAITGPVTVTTRDGSETPVTTWVAYLRNITIKVPEHVTEELDGLALEISFGRGAESPLDTHEPLWRLKCAALLALLHGRTEVRAEDWDMAAVMWETSRKVRDRVQAAAQRRTQAELDARRAEAVMTAAESQAAVYEVVNGVHPSVVNVAKRAHRYLTRHGGEIPARDVNRNCVATKDRDKYKTSGATESLWSAALQYGGEQGWLALLDDGAVLAAGSVAPEQS